MKIDLENHDINDLTNRCNSVASNNCTYDAAGNMTVDPDGYQYTYDYENRIVEIKDSGDTTVAEFAYDALGRRIMKTDSITAANTRYYYYNDQWQVLEERDGSDVLKQYFVYGNYIDEVLARFVSMIPLYYAHDHLYSPAALVNMTGTSIIERYEYDAYGTVTITGRGNDLLWYTADDVTLENSIYNPYTFTGRQLDVLDGGDLKIMYYRNRYYHPQLGRFMTQDPKWIVPLVKKQRFFYPYGQLLINRNLYEYVHSLPVKMLDPLGLEKWDKEGCEKEMMDELKDCLGKGEKFLDKCLDEVSDAFDGCIKDCKSLPVGLRHACYGLCATGGGYLTAGEN